MSFERVCGLVISMQITKVTPFGFEKTFPKYLSHVRVEGNAAQSKKSTKGLLLVQAGFLFCFVFVYCRARTPSLDSVNRECAGGGVGHARATKRSGSQHVFCALQKQIQQVKKHIAFVYCT